MNTNNDIEKIKAKEKVKVLTLLLVFFVLLGGIWEYQNSYLPLDNIVVVYKPVSKDAINKEEGELKEKTEVIKEENKIKDKSEKVEEIDNSKAMEEFLGYMDEVKNNLQEIEKPVMVLDKIIQEPEIKEEKKEVNPFEDGKLEIYDSEKGIVKVEEVKKVEEIKKEEKKVEEIKKEDVKEDKIDESLNIKEIEEQVFESKEENIDGNISDSVDGTIDMMKNIVGKSE
ncbi:MAG: hypothetical protein E7005_01595 [Alphaproteobacteria bacterium]|nr:hypothetical protein [Alphaproteobacteria bacterium]